MAMPRGERFGRKSASASIGVRKSLLDRWLARKLAWGTCSISYRGRVEEDVYPLESVHGDVRGRCPGIGRLTLSAGPSDEFAFDSRAAWPEDARGHDSAVLDAILDEVLGRAFGPVAARVRFTLEEVTWDE